MLSGRALVTLFGAVPEGDTNRLVAALDRALTAGASAAAWQAAESRLLTLLADGRLDRGVLSSICERVPLPSVRAHFQTAAITLPDDFGPPVPAERQMAVPIDLPMPLDLPMPPEAMPPEAMPPEAMPDLASMSDLAPMSDVAPVPAAHAKRATPPAAAPKQPRFLQAEVTASGGKRRHFAFEAGALHSVDVSVAPRVVGALQGDRAVNESALQPDATGSVQLEVHLVAPGANGSASLTQSSTITLPATGASTTANFLLRVPSDVTELACSVLLFHRAVLLQSAELSGRVAKADKKTSQGNLALILTAELAPPGDPVGTAGTGPTSSVSFHVGASTEALVVDDAKPLAVDLVNVIDTSGFTERVVNLLRQALDSDSVLGAAAASKQQVDLLRSLARQGNALFQSLAPVLADVGRHNVVQIITAVDDVKPIELLYDYGQPKPTAKLCKNWRKALETGTCTCKPRAGLIATFCPLGFWGLRMVIERQLAPLRGIPADADPAGQLQPGATLSRLRPVLFAAASEVDEVNANESATTVTALESLLGKDLVLADSWANWRKAVKVHSPGLLVSLPHSLDAADELPALKIGRTSTLEVAGLVPSYIRPAKSTVGPVVFLLGCSTAVTDLPWQSAVNQFRRQGASVVVGTLVATLGRQTGPMAREIASMVFGPDAPAASSLGELMLGLRRRLVLSGATLGMSLVAFGSASWQLTPDSTRSIA